ncbi:MAG: hypothetical protein ABUT39_07865 [Acidobacteriota bacterium]
MSRARRNSCLLIVLILGLSWAAQAATVLQMNLEQMVGRSDRIFRGTVLDIHEGTVQAGGSALPVVTYRVRVEEAFKGTFDQVKGMQVAEIKMLGKLKSGPGSAQAHSPAPLIDLPHLQVGHDYLLLVTPKSAIGLSTTVGLGQGCFQVTGKPGQELAVNLNQNLGLLNGMGGSSLAAEEPAQGPMPYSVLANLIRGIVD